MELKHVWKSISVGMKINRLKLRPAQFMPGYRTRLEDSSKGSCLTCIDHTYILSGCPMPPTQGWGCLQSSKLQASRRVKFLSSPDFISEAGLFKRPGIRLAPGLPRLAPIEKLKTISKNIIAHVIPFNHPYPSLSPVEYPRRGSTLGLGFISLCHMVLPNTHEAGSR